MYSHVCTTVAADMPLNSDESTHEVEDILAQVRDDFQKFLHLSEILPSLYKRSLLSSNEMDALLGVAGTRQEKVDRLLHILPRKGVNILRHLIDCLHETKAGTGSAHVELAEMLEGEVTMYVHVCSFWERME